MACIFCQIAAGEVGADTLYQDEEVIAFRDIHPVAPTHVIIIPRKHIPSLAELTEAESSLVASMIKVATQLAKSEGIAEKGYRLVINSGKQGGQFVPHLHMHLIGGRQLSSTLR
jgi:histidine triad (HIT) family protein